MKEKAVALPVLPDTATSADLSGLLDLQSELRRQL